MKSRSTKRIPASIKVRFRSCKTEYSGTVKNISENGMFILLEKIFLPFDLRFQILIPLWEKTIQIPVEVVRITKSSEVYDGIGVKLLNQHEDYSKFVESLRVVYKRKLGENQTADIYGEVDNCNLSNDRQIF